MSTQELGARVRRPNPSLECTPRLGDWLRICVDGHVVARSGKVELGQGILTALAQIVADELDLDLARVRMQRARTDRSPDEGYTVGSMSVQHSGDALREVCAQARAIYLRAAADFLGEPLDALRVVDGDIVAASGGRTSYWELADDALLDVTAQPEVLHKDPSRYVTVTRSVPRLDIPDKIAGRPRFIHDLRLDGQLFGRVVRPPARAATLLSVDDAAVRRTDGVVTVVCEGNFLGVVAAREEVAVRAAAALEAACRWQESDSLPEERDLEQFLLSAPVETTVIHDSRTGDAGTGEAPSAGVPERTVHARFSRGYVAHASLAPSCGVAVWHGEQLSVWSHSQGIFGLRAELARAFGVDQDAVVVEHVEGAGCYGHNGADDAAYDAALLARAVPGSPVQVVWSRQDELTWEPFGPAMVVDIDVDLGPADTILDWRQQVWSNGHTSRPDVLGHPPLLGATHREPWREPFVAFDPSFSHGGGSARNAVPLYALPHVSVVTHRLLTMPLRTTALRALGAHLNVFAIESVIDELAEAAGADPIEYRIGLLRDERARAVLEAVAQRSGWRTRTAADRTEAHGRGVGLARYKNTGAYCAVVADVEAESEVRVTGLTIAVDVGLVVNPDGVENQIEGGALQSVSWTTLEAVHFDRRQVTSRTWEEYPILTFEQAPPVDIVLMDRPDLPPVGSGEAAAGPTAAAIGNAVANALGTRVRALPLTPANIVRALSVDA